MASKDKQLQESLLQDVINTNNRNMRNNSVAQGDYMIATQLESLAGAGDDISMRRNCCFIFSLQTGVTIIVLVDLTVFVMLACMTGMAFDDFNMIYGGEDKNVANGTWFTILSDGVILIIFGIRTLLGLHYVRKSIWPPKMDYQYI